MRTSKINTQNIIDVQQGTLLCATPINPSEDNFKSLVLITRHSNLGSCGVILNSPLGIKAHIHGLITGPKSLELNYGGPDDDGLSFLVSLPTLYSGWKDSIYWSKNFNDLKLLLGHLNIQNIDINAYKGFIRWKPGELMTQVENKHWWVSNDYSVNEITNNSINTWSSFARRTGGHFAPLVDIECPILFN